MPCVYVPNQRKLRTVAQVGRVAERTANVVVVVVAINRNIQRPLPVCHRATCVQDKTVERTLHN